VIGMNSYPISPDPKLRNETDFNNDTLTEIVGLATPVKTPSLGATPDTVA
jgi:hypothetical protein